MAKSGKEVNWVLVLILSVLLGSLGIDRFIMGHVGLGSLSLSLSEAVVSGGLLM